MRVIADLSRERFRSRFGRDNAAGIVLALVVEALLLLALLTLGAHVVQEEPKGDNLTVVEFKATEEKKEEKKADEKPKQAEEKPKESERQSAQAPVPSEEKPKPPTPKPAKAEMLELTTNELAAADLSKLKSAPKAAAPAGKAMVGPLDNGTPGDTPRVSGAGPNGEPLYAASWYREPYDSELRGYLSTATPGWALIACRTAPNYRVENCVKVDEWPDGSNMARAVLAAAWQFQVRPPRVGGRTMIGEWVRIRIDYNIKRN